MGAENIHEVIRAFAKYGIPAPTIGSSAYFHEGFESHGIYSTACATAHQRLYVLGRKNRKLFDKDHRDFFSRLADRRPSFDFKCLFLDPNAPAHVLTAAHRDPDFREQLIRCVAAAAVRLIEAGLNPEDHARLYRVPRSLAYLVIDGAVAYTPVQYDASGYAANLTKCGFTLASGTSSFGNELVSQFLAIWEAATPLRAADWPI